MEEPKINSHLTRSTEACPRCGHEMPVNAGFATWCDQCHWNIDPNLSNNRRERLWSRVNEWLGAKQNTAIYENVQNEESFGFRFTYFRVLAYAFATIWYILFFLLAYKTVITLYTFRTLGDLTIGLFLAGLSYTLLPRMNRLKKPPLDRNQYPNIYRVADEVSKFLGAPPIDGIVIDSSFNAAYTIVGLRRKKIIIIGLPLFASLAPEEKLSILSHEMGHHANKDITRSSYLGGVQRAIGRLYWSVYPKTDYVEILSFFANLQEWIRRGLSYPILFLWYVMGIAVWRDSQRAEYYADYAAVSVAGTSAAVAAMRKLFYGPTFYKTIDMIAKYNYTKKLFEDFRSRIQFVPEREVERIRILTETLESSVESTHPPTRFRLAYMKAKSPSDKPMINQELLNGMEKEFLEIESIREKQMLRDYREYYL